MTAEEMERLPGSEIVLAGIADLRAGRRSVEASAVQSAATRLRRLGFEAPGASPDVSDRRRSQALSKLERGFDLDLRDVTSMVESGLVDPHRLLELFEGIEGELFRFPAVDPAGLRRAVEDLPT